MQLSTAVLLVEVMRAEPDLKDTERDAVITVLRRKFGREPSVISKILDSVLTRVHCEPVTAQTVLSALQWGERLGYSHYDSQIIAAALAADCSVLYSEDMQHGQLIDGRLTIVNPFAR